MPTVTIGDLQRLSLYMAGQLTSAVAITGGTIDSVTVGINTPAAGSFTTITLSGSETFSSAAAGPILKQGANGRVGTFVLTGATPVSVANTSVAASDFIGISLNTVGGTVGVYPHIATLTASTGFTVVGTAGDTSTYNYCIIKNAA